MLNYSISEDIAIFSSKRI